MKTLEEIESALSEYSLKGYYSLDEYEKTNYIKIRNGNFFFKVVGSLRNILGEEIVFEITDEIKTECQPFDE